LWRREIISKSVQNACYCEESTIFAKSCQCFSPLLLVMQVDGMGGSAAQPSTRIKSRDGPRQPHTTSSSETQVRCAQRMRHMRARAHGAARRPPRRIIRHHLRRHHRRRQRRLRRRPSNCHRYSQPPLCSPFIIISHVPTLRQIEAHLGSLVQQLSSVQPPTITSAPPETQIHFAWRHTRPRCRV